MSVINSARWLGQAALTETKRPEEWALVQWVMRFRAESPRYPDEIWKVVTQRHQFSAYDASPVDRFDEVAIFDWMRSRLERAGVGDPLVNGAVAQAEAVLSAKRWEAPFGPDVLHYFSPRSMVPANSMPPWAPHAYRLFSVPPVSPARFIFAEGVP